MKVLWGIILFILFNVVNQSAFAWNDDVTHADMSQYAAENSVLDKNKGDYLFNNLGFEGGLEKKFKWNIEKNVTEWLRQGAVEEDAGTKTEALAGKARYLNHFYNPLKPWLDAGLTGFFSGESSVLWSQDGVKQTNAVGGDWSWQTIRSNYRKALTSITNTDRQVFFAQTFRGLGQQIHLIQDMAQPAHVRNDAHPTDDSGKIPGFEFWAKRPDNEPIVKPLMANPIFPTIDSPITISRFYDTDQYDGTNPSTSLTLGLAEYTNANFASEDTITSFPYPRLNDMQYYEELTGTWGSFYKYRKYYRKTGGGEKIEHFANAGRLTKYLDTYTVLQTNTLGLDDKVYSDYAEKLIPRAVGYSAELLNYFFRGKIFMEKDPQNAGKYIIKNESNEKMEGTFALYYDDTSENRNAVPGASWTLTINPNSQSSSVTFTEPTSPAPKEKGKYILVFQGKLGMEEEAVVGREVTLTPECKMAISGPELVSLRSAVGYSLSGAAGNVTWSVDNSRTRISGNSNGATLTIGPWGWPALESACSFGDPKGQIIITATDQVCSKTFTAQAGQWVLTYHDEICGYRHSIDWREGKYCTSDDACLRWNDSDLYGCSCEFPEVKGACSTIKDGKVYYTEFASNDNGRFSGCITPFCSSNNPNATIPIATQISEWRCP